MDSPRAAEDGPSQDTADFVRFCYRRRRARWPELYDEMCAVASRGLYRGWSFPELADHGIGFGLFDMPRMAAVVARVAGEEAERRSRVPVVMLPSVDADSEPAGDRGTESRPMLATAGIR
jgi:hypothetical protein